MTGNWVFDSTAVFGILEGRPIGAIAKEVFVHAAAGRATVFLHEITLSETITATWRKLGEERAGAIDGIVQTSPVRLVSTSGAFLRSLAALRAKTILGLGDGVVAALAMHERATILTADNDFRAVSKLVRVRIVRAR